MPTTRKITDHQKSRTETEATSVATVAAEEIEKTEIVQKPQSNIIQFSGNSGIEGEWDSSDVRIPSLRVVRRSDGKNIEGTLLIDDDVVLEPPSLKSDKENNHLRFLVCSIQKRYREQLSDAQAKEGMRPLVYDTQQEVNDAGGTLYKTDTGQARFRKVAILNLLVEKPDECNSDAFDVELDGKWYAAVKYYAYSWTDYSGMACDIINAVRGKLTQTITDKDGKPILDDNGRTVRQVVLHKYFWTMETETKNVNGFNVTTPNVKLTDDQPGSQAVEYINDLLGA